MNDSGFDWGGTLGGLLDTGLGVFKATQTDATGAENAKKLAAAQKAAAAQSAEQRAKLTKYGVIGGAVLLVVIVAAFALRRGK